MLLPDGIYQRIPLFWLLGGLLFLLLGLSGGRELDFYYAYLVLGMLCIWRGVWIYQARWKRHRRNQVSILKSTQVINHADLER